MTLIISWIRPALYLEGFEVWTISDGKIMSNDRTLTLEGSKVLQLHICCTHMQGPPPRKVYYRGSVGFSFAGSSLVGLNTFSTLSDVMSSLGGDEQKNNLPSYADIVEKAKLILAKYTSSIQSHCEVSLFGFCPKTKMPFISVIRPILKAEVMDYDVEHVVGEQEGLNCVLLGDSKGLVTKLLMAWDQEYDPTQHQFWNIPTGVFYYAISEKLIETVGGGIQLGIAYQDEFRMNAISKPTQADPEKSTLVFKNFDIFEDIGLKVGECVFAMDSMDIGIRAFKKRDDKP